MFFLLSHWFAIGEKKMKILGKADLKTKGIDFNDSTLWRKTKAGQFPKAIMIGNRRGWLEHEVDQYVESLIAKRDTKVVEAA
jgi:predicted DNA-binding transcriptional regulator AlpA